MRFSAIKTYCLFNSKQFYTLKANQKKKNTQTNTVYKNYTETKTNWNDNRNSTTLAFMKNIKFCNYDEETCS